MLNSKEAKRWLKDAEAALTSAKKNVSLKEFRVVVQNSQMAIEGSAKAVISCFAHPDWSHDPRDQLMEIIELQQEPISRKMGRDILARLE